jgi:uncharacterized membrane protein
MTILALALHILGAIVWVGGMFAIYMCLRPALGETQPERLMLDWMFALGGWAPRQLLS